MLQFVKEIKLISATSYVTMQVKNHILRKQVHFYRKTLHPNVYSAKSALFAILYVRCVWPTAAEALSTSGSSGVAITIESDKGSVSSLDSKPSSKLSPELLERLRNASGNFPSPCVANLTLYGSTMSHVKVTPDKSVDRGTCCCVVELPAGL